MDKFNYITGYLPEVSSKETHNKKIRKRIMYATGITVSVLFSTFLLMNITSAQYEQAAPMVPVSTSETPVSKSIQNKPIWLSFDLASISFELAERKVAINRKAVKNLPPYTQTGKTVKTVDPAKQAITVGENASKNLETLYQEDLERLLNRAFANSHKNN